MARKKAEKEQTIYAMGQAVTVKNFSRIIDGLPSVIASEPIEDREGFAYRVRCGSLMFTLNERYIESL